MDKGEIKAVVGSGNVFEDLGVSNSEESLAKAELANQIHNSIKSRRLTQKAAAEIMGIDQPKVSEIVRGKLSRYSIDRLLRYLLKLGRDVEIRVKKHVKRSKPTRLYVIGVDDKGKNKRISA